MTNYMPRMPQVGEKWRLYVRNGEAVCPCGNPVDAGEKGSARESFLQAHGETGVIVEGSGLVDCHIHGRYGMRRPVGWFVIHLKNDSTFAVVPYTWLEPITEPQP